MERKSTNALRLLLGTFKNSKPMRKAAWQMGCNATLFQSIKFFITFVLFCLPLPAPLKILIALVLTIPFIVLYQLTDKLQRHALLKPIHDSDKFAAITHPPDAHPCRDCGLEKVLLHDISLGVLGVILQIAVEILGDRLVAYNSRQILLPLWILLSCVYIFVNAPFYWAKQGYCADHQAVVLSQYMTYKNNFLWAAVLAYLNIFIKCLRLPTLAKTIFLLWIDYLAIVFSLVFYKHLSSQVHHLSFVPNSDALLVDTHETAGDGGAIIVAMPSTISENKRVQCALEYANYISTSRIGRLLVPFVRSYARMLEQGIVPWSFKETFLLSEKLLQLAKKIAEKYATPGEHPTMLVYKLGRLYKRLTLFFILPSPQMMLNYYPPLRQPYRMFLLDMQQTLESIKKVANSKTVQFASFSVNYLPGIRQLILKLAPGRLALPPKVIEKLLPLLVESKPTKRLIRTLVQQVGVLMEESCAVTDGSLVKVVEDDSQEQLILQSTTSKHEQAKSPLRQRRTPGKDKEKRGCFFTVVESGAAKASDDADGWVTVDEPGNGRFG